MTVVQGGKRSDPYTATTLAEYINRVGLIKTKQKLFFRGLSDLQFELDPSINRSVENGDRRVWLEKESRLVEYAEQTFPGSFDKATPAMIVSNLQHYGIPTRMLDVTGNALVALFFACAPNDDKDGEVVVFEGETVSAYNPYANIIADTYRLTNNAITNLETYRYLIYQQAYTSTLSYPGWENDTENIHFFSMLDKPLIVDVGAVNQRQVNQDGKFILFPNRMDEKNILNKLVRLDKSDSMVKALIRIPAGKKSDILKQLKLAGITEAFIFPDEVGKTINRIKESIRDENWIIDGLVDTSHPPK